MNKHERDPRTTFEERLLGNVNVMKVNGFCLINYSGKEELGDDTDPVRHRDEVNLVLHANGVQGFRAEVKTFKQNGEETQDTFIVREINDLNT